MQVLLPKDMIWNDDKPRLNYNRHGTERNTVNGFQDYLRTHCLIEATVTIDRFAQAILAENEALNDIIRGAFDEFNIPYIPLIVIEGSTLNTLPSQMRNTKSSAVKISNQVIKDVCFNGSYMADWQFENCRLINCQFNDVVLDHCRFLNSSLSNCQFKNGSSLRLTFEQTSLRGCMFDGSHHHALALTHVSTRSCSFDKTNISAFRLKFSDLQMTDFNHAVLRGSRIHANGFSGCSFNNADLSGSVMRACAYDSVSFNETNMLNVQGVYSVSGHWMSSRHDSLDAYVTIFEGQIELRFVAGCQVGLTHDELIKRIDEYHPYNSSYYQNYMLAVDFITRLFTSDLTNGRWNYLKTLNQ